MLGRFAVAFLVDGGGSVGICYSSGWGWVVLAFAIVVDGGGSVGICYSSGWWW